MADAPPSLSRQQRADWQATFHALVAQLLAILDCPASSAQYEYESERKIEAASPGLLPFQWAAIESTLGSCLAMVKDARRMSLSEPSQSAVAGAEKDSANTDKRHTSRRQGGSSLAPAANIAAMREWKSRMRALLTEQRKKTTASNLREFSSPHADCSRTSPLRSTGMIRKEQVDNLDGPLDATLAFLPKSCQSRAPSHIDDDLLVLKNGTTLDVRLTTMEQLLFRGHAPGSYAHASVHPLVRLQRIEQALLSIEKNHPSVALACFHYDAPHR